MFLVEGDDMKKLYTIGYEGIKLDDFLETLDKAQIDVLLDIREFPISRRKGFSKNILCEALAEFDIDYRHEKRLGSPKNIRHKLRKDHDYEAFFKAFGRYLQKQNGLLQELTEELSGNIALMCYEKDHTLCHRLPVVDALADMLGLTPKHLEVNSNEPRKTRKTPYSNISQSFSTA
ncbi:MAG: hypothetical protein A2W76_05695 [Gammaproteobacteria bacterium RIFCSPLOWO2_12_47_11]|nr:MAG: hypothetical protein A2W76_05695 [Gammaproteobacteria bacterium RIFCSPLOWO2_12_47_11]